MHNSQFIADIFFQIVRCCRASRENLLPASSRLVDYDMRFGRLLIAYCSIKAAARIVAFLFRALCVNLTYLITASDVALFQQRVENSGYSAAALTFLPPSLIWRPTGRQRSAAEVTSR